MGGPAACVASPGVWPELLEIAKAYAARNQLVRFYTTLDPRTNPLFAAVGRLPGTLGQSLKRDAARRRFDDLDSVEECAPILDLLHAVVYRASGKSRLNERVLELRDRHFDAQVARRIGDVPIYIGQAGACSKTLRALSSRSGTTIVNWNIQYWPFARAQYELERRAKPQWLKTFSFTRFPDRQVRFWEEELARVGAVLVPSAGVALSLRAAGVAADRLIVVPYGVDTDRYRPAESSAPPAGPLRVVCVGEIGQRKGLAYLFDVARRAPRVRFYVVGWRVAALPERIPENVEIAQNVPDVRPYLQTADVFYFPSLVDGFGLVVLQALASGLPVICSANAGARDIVSEDDDGFVVDPRDVQRTVEILEELGDDRQRLSSMKHAARAKAEQYPWERFHRDVLAQVSAFHQSRRGEG